MCPPAPVPPPSDISFYWSDEEIFMCLEKLIRGGFPLPANVYADLNPYQYPPSNLPDGIWYYIRSEENKDTGLGFWKGKGEACKIYTNSVITGWRTTLEFYEGQAPHGRKTDWVMQEYRITQKGLCEDSQPKGSSSLCRVFISGGRSPKCEMQHNLAGADVSGRGHIHSMQSVVPNANSNTGQCSTSNSQLNSGEDETGQLAVTERLPNHPVENLPEMNHPVENLPEMDDDDYLELLDLESRSFSSENSSCLTISSDECFDSLALLQDLECETNQNFPRKDAGCKFSVSASLRPNEVVMCPDTSGSLFRCNRSKSPAAKPLKTHGSVPGSAIEAKLLDGKVSKPATGTQRADQRNEGPSSNSHNVAASSSSQKATTDKKEAVVGRMKKLKRKYFCFMPF